MNEGYKLITKEQDGTINYGMNGKGWKNLWNLKTPYKICLFLWKLLHDGLLTRMELIRRQIIVIPKGVMCDQEDETLDHLFLKCHFARALWFALPWNFCSNAIPSIRQWLITTLEKYKASNGQDDNVLTNISATLWVIWTYRNKVMFENETVDVQQAISITRYLLKEWKTDLDACIQIGSTTTATVGNQTTCRYQNWQAIIIVDTKTHSRETNWNGGTFVIKNRLGQSVCKGCYSWHSNNNENNLLSTIKEALYEVWK